jgi:hypothetical protein
MRRGIRLMVCMRSIHIFIFELDATVETQKLTTQQGAPRQHSLLPVDTVTIIHVDQVSVVRHPSPHTRSVLRMRLCVTE